MAESPDACAQFPIIVGLDFGTTYSGFSYSRNDPITEVERSRRFIYFSAPKMLTPTYKDDSYLGRAYDMLPPGETHYAILRNATRSRPPLVCVDDIFGRYGLKSHCPLQFEKDFKEAALERMPRDIREVIEAARWRREEKARKLEKLLECEKKSVEAHRACHLEAMKNDQIHDFTIHGGIECTPLYETDQAWVIPPREDFPVQHQFGARSSRQDYNEKDHNGGTKPTVQENWPLTGDGDHGYQAMDDEWKCYPAYVSFQDVISSQSGRYLRKSAEETGILAELQRPSVVHLFFPTTVQDSKETKQNRLTELSPLKDLHDLVVQQMPRDLEPIIDIMLQISQGLLYMHGRRVAHRDLKPSNALVCSNVAWTRLDFGLTVNLSDFGVARPTSNFGLRTESLALSSRTRSVGNHSYLAPAWELLADLEELVVPDVDSDDMPYALCSLLHASMFYAPRMIPDAFRCAFEYVSAMTCYEAFTDFQILACEGLLLQLPFGYEGLQEIPNALKRLRETAGALRCEGLHYIRPIWSTEDIRALLKTCLQAPEQEAGPDWGYVSKLLLGEYGIDLDSTSCKILWGSLLRCYNAIRDYEMKIYNGKSNGPSFFEMDEEERSRNMLPPVFDLEWCQMMETILKAKPVEVQSGTTPDECTGYSNCEDVLCADDKEDESCESAVTEVEDSTADSYVPQTEPTYTDKEAIDPSAALRNLVEDMVRPLITAVRTRVEEEQKHRQKVLAAEMDKVALMLQDIRRVMVHSNEARDQLDLPSQKISVATGGKRKADMEVDRVAKKQAGNAGRCDLIIDNW